MHVYQIGDWVTWGSGQVGRVRYFTQGRHAVFVSVQPVPGHRGRRQPQLQRVPVAQLKPLAPQRENPRRAGHTSGACQ